MAAARKAAILAQVGHFYFGDPGHITIGADNSGPELLIHLSDHHPARLITDARWDFQ
jgi:hypothetical protein